MGKLICMQGLPASGKSTRAAAIMRECGNAVRINRDLLRTMLHCDVWSGAREHVTKDAARLLARHYLVSDQHVGVVIIDDTNLHPGTLASWKQLAIETESAFEVERLETPIDECVFRDAKRAKPVGKSVIMGMAMQYGLVAPPDRGYIICDIDGTVADIRHRLHYLSSTPKDWDGFFAAIPGDKPRDDVIRMVRFFADLGSTVVFVSGRNEECRAATEAFLAQYAPPYAALFMRRTEDRRPDTDVKEEILHTYFADLSTIRLVIDDRPSVIRMWRSHGLNVADVGTGEEF